MINATVIYVLWLREMKRFGRAKSRVIGSLAMPLFFLAFMGMGFNRMAVPGLGRDVNYIQFLVPGILGMSLLFSSTFGGLSVLWDREFGFLKEIMVAPVHRVSIVLGRIAGGMTTALIQGLMILGISIVLGFRVRSLTSLALALAAMLLIASSFLGLGLIFASLMKDIQGFSLIMNFVIFPLFFLSGALYPLENMPKVIRLLSLADPLTYGIDGLRGFLLGQSTRPPAVDIAIMAGISVFMVLAAAYAFEKSKSL